MRLNNKRGISLVLTLILLVVVGLLASALMRSSVHNINFSQNELDEKRAFYAAEAGVEHTRAEASSSLEILNSKTEGEPVIPNDDGEEYVELDYNDSNEEIKYQVIYLGDDEYEAVGIVNGEFEQRIRFDIEMDEGLGDLVMLLNKLSASEIYEFLPDEGNSDDRPSESDEWKSSNPDFESLAESGELDDIELWSENDIYQEGDTVVDLVETLGEEKEFSKDNIGLFDLLDEEDGNFVENDWNSFIEEFKEEFDEDFDEESIEKITSDVIEDNKYYSHEKVEIGADIEEYEEYSEDTDYEKDEVVQYNDSLYFAEDYISQDEEETQKPDDPSTDWEKIDDEQEFNSTTIKDNVVIIEGSLKMEGNVTVEESLVIVRDNIDFGGSQTFDSSLIFGFNQREGDDTDDSDVTVRGTPSTDIDSPLTSDVYKHWPLVNGILEDLENLYGSEGVIHSWRPVN